jgi:hypothetical protein
MLALFAAFLFLVQNPQSGPGRVEISPANPTIQVGDSIRLTAKAFDGQGRPVPSSSVRWFSSGEFQGTIDSTGLVRAGAVGFVVASALVRSEAGGKPLIGTVRVTIVSPPTSRIAVAPAVARMMVGQSLSLAAVPFAANGDQRTDSIGWSSDRPAVLSVSRTGRVSALEPGRVTLVAKAGRFEHPIPITVVPNTVERLSVNPEQTRVRTGDVFRFAVTAVGRGGERVPDVVPEWSITPGSAEIGSGGDFVAELPGDYRVTATFAGKVAVSTVAVRARGVTRPIKVVSHLPIGMMATEFWLHPDGKHGFLGTASLGGGPGGDRLYAVDLTDPAAPVITDSVMVDARIINDVMTTEDGKYAVMGREQASSRKNGIVILNVEDPAHPKPIAEYTETVSGGVHSTYVYQGHVYLTDDATGSMRVIDIKDPYHPKEVGRWQTPWLEGAGRYLHDIDVKEGLAYLSYWNDGLVILDVGSGIKGGTPERPQLVSQLKYDLVSLYREVEVVGGPGHIRGTHTAWRAGKYVFVGDEVFAATPVGIGIPALGRAFGRLHVVDVSDLTRPKEVAYYEPKDGGAHNIWVAGDTLFLGDYQGGLRVVDISGELRGDLLRQGREIAHFETADPKAFVPNAPMAWGAIYRNGLIFVPDANSGLWVVRIEPRRELVP